MKDNFIREEDLNIEDETGSRIKRSGEWFWNGIGHRGGFFVDNQHRLLSVFVWKGRGKTLFVPRLLNMLPKNSNYRIIDSIWQIKH